jgi:tRNA threonylcarbamoyladenosine biosynthesis protein TsaE
MAEHHIELADEAATLRLGRALAAGARNGLVLYLTGELGAGKTTLARGLLQGLGYAGRVKSPSYSLVELYEVSRLNFYHFDLYRFKDRTEWVSSGFRDYFGPQALCIVEWPERAEGLLVPADLTITLQISGAGRTARLSASTDPGRDWLESARRHCS